MVPTNSKSPRTVQSLDRAFAILNLLAESPQGLSLSQIAQTLALPPQTVQSLVRTLQVHEMATQTAKGQPYCIGPAVARLARQFNSGDGPMALLRQAALEVAQHTGEYILLAQLRGRTLMPLVEVQSNQTLTISPASSELDRLHAMATGKLLLAFAPPKIQQNLLAEMHLVPKGPNTITNRNALKKNLKEIAHAGYCITIEEGSPHTCAIAVPVRDMTGLVRAALGTSVPMVRFTTQHQEMLLEQLKQTAAKMERIWP